MNREQNFLLTRRSTRKYSDKEIEKKKIEVILKAGMYAPSAHNTQPWHFIVIRNKNLMCEISKVHRYAGMTKNASAVILVCADTARQDDPGYFSQDCSAATENILLSAHIEGIGACWIGIYPVKERMEKISALLKLKKNLAPFSLIALGYPGETIAGKDPERYDKKKIEFVD
ncbi:MAG: nitroreductase family protein [bacterium]